MRIWLAAGVSIVLAGWFIVWANKPRVMVGRKPVRDMFDVHTVAPLRAKLCRYLPHSNKVVSTYVRGVYPLGRYRDAPIRPHRVTVRRCTRCHQSSWAWQPLPADHPVFSASRKESS